MRTVYHPLTAEQEPVADIFFNYEAFLPNTVTPKHQHSWGQLQLISGGIMELHAAGQRFYRRRNMRFGFPQDRA